jgi:hypothetical protein
MLAMLEERKQLVVFIFDNRDDGLVVDVGMR